MALPRSSSLPAAVGALAAARLVMNTAQRFVYPFLPAIARGLGVSLGQAGLMVSARWLAGLATPLVVATAGRAESRRRLAATGLGLFVVGAVVTAGTSVYVGALVGFILMGVAKPAFDIAAQSYVADRTPYERRARYLGVLELTWAGGLLVGAPAAGWLIAQLDWRAPFWALAGAAVAIGGVLWLVLDPDAAGADGPPGRLRLGRPAAALLAVTALFSLAAELVFVVFGAWLEDAYGLSLLALGGTATVVGLSELAGEGAVLAFTDRIGKRRSVAIGLAISVVGFASLALEPASLVVGVALVSAALLGFEFTIVAAIPLATEMVPGARARYLAWFIVAMNLGRAVGAAGGPWLFDRFGVAGNALAAAAVDLMALIGLVALLGVSERRGEQAVPEPRRQ